jgi:hypothetical protein
MFAAVHAVFTMPDCLHSTAAAVVMTRSAVFAEADMCSSADVGEAQLC